MYYIIKRVITNHTYTDLNRLLEKIKRAWIEQSITEEEYQELTNLALTNDPVKDYAVQEQIDKLWAAIHALEARIESSNIQPDNNENQQQETINDYVQPTGAHDAYQTGDKVRYNNAIYESLINGNVWAPDVYPAGWKLIEE